MLVCFGAAPVMIIGQFMRRVDGVRFTEEL